MTTTYTISISEQQRALLLAAIDASLQHDPRAAAYDGTAEDEPYVLRELLHTLPDSEAESVTMYGAAPGSTVHGFTL